MKITVDWLKEKNACTDGLVWFKKQEEETDGKKIVEKLITEN